MEITAIHNGLRVLEAPRANTQHTTQTNTPQQKAVYDIVSLTKSVSLAAASPKLAEMLDTIARQGGDVLAHLDNNITHLQDGFMDTLSFLFEEQGIQTDQKITLGVDAANKLTVVAPNENNEKIQQVLDNNKELSDVFLEMSLQSDLAKNIRGIQNLVSKKNPYQAYASSALAKQNSPYQVTIKGEMSHFYFAQ